MRIRTYSELRQLETFEDRYEYLRLRGEVGGITFGFDRYMNQQFYRSTQWRHCRDEVISRDLGRDLGIRGREIYNKVVIHHMNPMVPEDLIGGESHVLDLEFLISTTHQTHMAIHYGDRSLLLASQPTERRPGDTTPWKRQGDRDERQARH